jgi:hypothetical protein
MFGLAGFGIFAGVHWSIDFMWYTVVGFLFFKTQRFWTRRVHLSVTLFCVGVFLLFGAFFVGSALIEVFTLTV